MSTLQLTTATTGICPDCFTHEADLCALCHTAVGCHTGPEGHVCVTPAA
jgi:hypothetical protein